MRATATATVKAPVDQVWAVLAHHEGMASWGPGMKVSLDREGTADRNGVGRWVSWSQGQGAMTAARLGQTENALAIILNPTARYMANGHVRRPAEPKDCPAFIPVNASLLAAAGLMAGGWDGAPAGELPGFPRDPKWKVAAEGLNRMP